MNDWVDFRFNKHYQVKEEIISTDIYKKILGINSPSEDLNIDIKFPSFKYLFKNKLLARVNEEILNDVFSKLSPEISDYSFEYEVLQDNPQFLTIKFDSFTFYKGSLNGDNSIGSINIDIKNNRYIEFFDIFDANKNSQDEIKEIILEKIEEKCSGVLKEKFIKNSYIPRFILDKEKIHFLFSEYEVTAGFCGALSVEVPYSELVDFFRKDSVFSPLLKLTGNWTAERNKYKSPYYNLEKNNERTDSLRSIFLNQKN